MAPDDSFDGSIESSSLAWKAPPLVVVGVKEAEFCETRIPVGTRLAVEYFGERYPVTVAVAGATPLFDPDNARIRS